jgi:hypothetical protein
VEIEQREGSQVDTEEIDKMVKTGKRETIEIQGYNKRSTRMYKRERYQQGV